MNHYLSIILRQLTLFLFFFTLAAFGQNRSDTNFVKKVAIGYFNAKEKILKLEMHLSAFGVESDDAPNIDATIDFATDSGKCHRSYYDPRYKSSTYYLDTTQIHHILSLLQHTNLNKMQTDYTINRSDQPTSTTIIYTNLQTYKIRDYGLQGNAPLQELYKIVYKLEY